MGRVRRNANGFPRAHDGLLAAEVGFDLAFEDCERFLKVMPMRTWASARRNHHIDKAIASIGVMARQKNRVGVSHQCAVRQTLVLVRPREHEVSLQIVGRYRRDRLGGDCVLVHKSILFWLLVAGFISSGRSYFACEFRPRVSPIFSKAAAMSAVRFLKGRRPHLPLRPRARRIPGKSALVLWVSSQPGAL